jgi:hypothetical protein
VPEVNQRLCSNLSSRWFGRLLYKDEDLIPSIENFLESRDDLIPLPKFVRVNPLKYQADPLELFLARSRN